jgi:cystathionine beta-synthase
MKARLHEEINNSIYINQYFNELNSEAHYLSTGQKSGTNS